MSTINDSLEDDICRIKNKWDVRHKPNMTVL